MHFGRVARDDGLELSLPADRARTQGYLRLGHKGRALLYPGAPVWADRDWLGTVYPERTRPGEYLRYYARQYAAVEANGSFYHLPPLSQVQHWTRQVGPEFRFCPKLPKALSHGLGAGLDRPLLKAYLDLLAGYGDRHGLSFMQLPEGFGPEQLPALDRFLAAWSREWPLAIEFRHPGWFKDHMLLDPLIDRLYRAGISAVITDTPGRRDVLHMSLCAPQLIIRFLGCFPSSRDEQRLAAWAERLEGWLAAGLDTLYFFIHQERHPAIPASLDYFIREVMQRSVPGLMRPARGDSEEVWGETWELGL